MNTDVNQYNTESITIANQNNYNTSTYIHSDSKIPMVLHDKDCAPAYHTKGAAGADLKITTDTTLLPGVVTRVPTGVSLAIPEGYVGLLFMRSGLSNKGINLANSVGVIDSDYRGEIWLPLINNSTTTHTLKRGDRVSQIALMPVTQFQFVSVDKLPFTVRGEGKFGSTGV